MRWKGRRQSSNVEDRRGISAKKGMLGGGLGTIIISVASDDIIASGVGYHYLQALEFGEAGATEASIAGAYTAESEL